MICSPSEEVSYVYQVWYLAQVRYTRRMALTALPVTDKSSPGRRQGFSKMTSRGEKGRLRFLERLRNPKMLRMAILYFSTQAPSGVAWRDFCALSMQSRPDFMIH